MTLVLFFVCDICKKQEKITRKCQNTNEGHRKKMTEIGEKKLGLLKL